MFPSACHFLPAACFPLSSLLHVLVIYLILGYIHVVLHVFMYTYICGFDFVYLCCVACLTICLHENSCFFDYLYEFKLFLMKYNWRYYESIWNITIFVWVNYELNYWTVCTVFVRGSDVRVPFDRLIYLYPVIYIYL